MNNSAMLFLEQLFFFGADNARTKQILERFELRYPELVSQGEEFFQAAYKRPELVHAIRTCYFRGRKNDLEVVRLICDSISDVEANLYGYVLKPEYWSELRDALCTAELWLVQKEIREREERAANGG